MVPAVALRRPDDLRAVMNIEPHLLTGVARVGHQWPVVDERLALLRDDSASLAGPVDFDNPVDLMAALVVLERERAAVLPPDRIRKAVRVRTQAVVDVDLFPACDLEEHRLRDVERVAGLRIEPRGVLGLKLIGGRRLDIVNFAAIARLHPVGDESGGIGGPRDRGERVIVAFGAVKAERGGVGGALRAQEDVVILNESFPLAVRRGLHARRFGPLLAEWEPTAAVLLLLRRKRHHAIEDVVIELARAVVAAGRAVVRPAVRAAPEEGERRRRRLRFLTHIIRESASPR